MLTGGAASLDLKPDGGIATSGIGFDVTVTVYDSWGNVATGYSGTVSFDSGDGGASLPPDYTFIPADGGSHTFVDGVSLVSTGSQ